MESKYEFSKIINKFIINLQNKRNLSGIQYFVFDGFFQIEKVIDVVVLL